MATARCHLVQHVAMCTHVLLLASFKALTLGCTLRKHASQEQVHADTHMSPKSFGRAASRSALHSTDTVAGRWHLPAESSPADK